MSNPLHLWSLNLASCKESPKETKDIVHNMVKQTADPAYAIQRLYLLHSICEALEKEDDQFAKDFFARLFPMPLRNHLVSFISQLVSLAISLNTRQVLTSTAAYIEKEQTKLSDEDIMQLPQSLAESSPLFAAVLIDKGFFNVSSAKYNLISSDLLTKWLASLNECDSDDNIVFNGQSLIRYSLLGQGQKNSDLHYNILDAIQKKKIQPLSNQFVIDMASTLSQKGDEELCSKFAHILVMAVQNGLCNTLVSSNQMKNNLLDLFPENLLIKAVVNMKATK